MKEPKINSSLKISSLLFLGLNLLATFNVRDVEMEMLANKFSLNAFCSSICFLEWCQCCCNVFVRLY